MVRHIVLTSQVKTVLINEEQKTINRCLHFFDKQKCFSHISLTINLFKFIERGVNSERNEFLWWCIFWMDEKKLRSDVLDCDTLTKVLILNSPSMQIVNHFGLTWTVWVAFLFPLGIQ